MPHTLVLTSHIVVIHSSRCNQFSISSYCLLPYHSFQILLVSHIAQVRTHPYLSVDRTGSAKIFVVEERNVFVAVIYLQLIRWQINKTRCHFTYEVQQMALLPLFSSPPLSSTQLFSSLLLSSTPPLSSPPSPLLNSPFAPSTLFINLKIFFLLLFQSQYANRPLNSESFLSVTLILELLNKTHILDILRSILPSNSCNFHQKKNYSTLIHNHSPCCSILNTNIIVQEEKERQGRKGREGEGTEGEGTRKTHGK